MKFTVTGISCGEQRQSWFDSLYGKEPLRRRFSDRVKVARECQSS